MIATPRELPAKSRMLAILATGGLAACFVLFQGCAAKSTGGAAPPAARVTVALPIERETFDYEDFTGRTDAVESVEIRARVTGYLDKIAFKDGADVKEGEVLFEIDPRPFKAAYDQAAAQVKVRAADLKYRRAERERAEELLPKNAVSKSDYDQAVAMQEQADAAVAAARADERSAQLNVDFTTLRSPITGVMSRTQITRGNLVQADRTLLSTVVSVDPMYAYFDIDESTILDIQEKVRTGKLKAKDEHGTVPVFMALGDDLGFRHRGFIDFAENRFDPNTGTIRVRAEIPNPKPPKGPRVLIPGLYTNVRIPLGPAFKALTVVERAICTDQGQKYVLVVNDKNEAEYRPVTLGRLDGRLRVITEGVKPNDRIIVSGMQRVRPGETVEAKTVSMTSFADPADIAPEKPEVEAPNKK